MCIREGVQAKETTDATPQKYVHHGAAVCGGWCANEKGKAGQSKDGDERYTCAASLSV